MFHGLKTSNCSMDMSTRTGEKATALIERFVSGERGASSSFGSTRIPELLRLLPIKGDIRRGLMGFPAGEALTSTEWNFPDWSDVRCSRCHPCNLSTSSWRLPVASKLILLASRCRSRYDQCSTESNSAGFKDT